VNRKDVWGPIPGIVWEEIGGETVVVDPARNTAWVLNSTATRVWKRLCDGLSPEAIAAELAGAGRAASDVLAEISAFVAELSGLGLLRSGAVLAYAPASPGAAGTSAAPKAEPSLKPAPRVRRTLPLEKGPKRPHPRMGSVNPEGEEEEI
jgi:hypothetical protein